MGILGDPRNELEFSTRIAGLVASPGVPTGGVEEAPRPSRCFLKSSAFSSAARALICVAGRGGGVGLTVVA